MALAWAAGRITQSDSSALQTFSHFNVINQAQFAACRILVVGDVMLDRYWFGEVERISPEAPVPVVRIARNEERPGGAANVARNAAALGAQVTLVSVVGDDEAGRALERLLAGDQVRTSFHRDASLPTTVKLRVIGRQQQLLRIDFETVPSHEILATKLADYERTLPDFDVVVLSDYGKGGLAHIERMIDMARSRAGRSQGRGFPALPRRDDAYPEPRRIQAGRGKLAQRGGACNQGADIA